MRLLRQGNYPPYRGKHVELDHANHLLYRRGFVPYYETCTSSALSKETDHTVSKRPDRTWKHKRNDADRAISVHSTQKDAIDTAKQNPKTRSAVN